MYVLVAIVTLLTLIHLNEADPLVKSDVGLNTKQIIENHGYICENHYIITEDGYILTYQRIPHGRNNKDSGKRPAVLVIHGLIASSASFVSWGTNRSLGFILADSGYDVWLGNTRGNAWARNHTTLDVVADDEQFFDFSWHEMGYYDVAAAIAYILKIKGDKSLYFIGHSLGGTVFLALAAARPEYNAKIRLATLMGPAALFTHQSRPIINILAKHVNEIERLLKKFKVYEVPLTKELRQFAIKFCTDPTNYDICLGLLYLGEGANTSNLEQEALPVFYSNLPSNAAAKPYLHYFQLMRDGGFSHYDYGVKKNRKIYGRKTPPAYNLRKISAPVAYYYGTRDLLVDYRDSETVIKNLSNVVDAYKGPYNHVDYLVARDVVDNVYNRLISLMKMY